MDQILTIYNSIEASLTPSIIIDLIKRSISQNGLFAFSEFKSLLTDRISSRPELATPLVQKWMQVLDIFSFSTWNDYLEFNRKTAEDSEVDLDEAQSKKLKMMTLATLGAHDSILKYKQIESQLSIGIDEVEAIVVDAVYEGLLTGKLDSKRQLIEVDAVYGRDVSFERLDEIGNLLEQWVHRTERVLAESEDGIQRLRKDAAERDSEIKHYNEEVAKINIKLNSSHTQEA